MPTLSTRGPVTAQAIADLKDFKTHGALRGENVKSLSNWDSGQLSGDDLTQFRRECSRIEYVVYSYSTPIAWYLSDKGWYRVQAKFSLTTSKHQGMLYLIPLDLYCTKCHRINSLVRNGLCPDCHDDLFI